MRTSRTWASVLLAAYLVLASVGARGAVLCVGEDGHLAVEFGCFGESCSAPAMPGAELSTSQCGSCVDTPLLGDLARATLQTDRTASATSPAVLAEAAPFALQPPVVAALPYGGTPPSTFSIILRTNALLI